MMVDMPVEAIDKRCLRCPELDISVDTLEFIRHQKSCDPQSMCINTLKCNHVERCRILLESTRDEQAP